MWMDHRAVEQAERINSTKNDILDTVGGKISPEMQLPKLLWLKENNPLSYARLTRAYDLCDYLVHRATGSNKR